MRLAEDPVDHNRCVLTFHTTYTINASSTFLKNRAESLVSKLYLRALKRGRAVDRKFIDKVRSRVRGVVPLAGAAAVDACPPSAAAWCSSIVSLGLTVQKNARPGQPAAHAIRTPW